MMQAQKQEAPKGFVRIPAGKDPLRQPEIMVMKTPVTVADYKAFIAWLTPINRVDANRCNGAVPNDADPKNPYVILADGYPTNLYATYLSEKLNVMSLQYRCRLISEAEWKRLKGPSDLEPKAMTLRNGITFFKDMYEWKLNNKGQPYSYTDLNGYQRSAFRMVLEPVAPKTENNPTKK